MPVTAQAQRAMAIAVMRASVGTRNASFAASRGVTIPEVSLGGALPGWKYNLIPPKDLKLPVHLLMQFSIGDFLPDWPCSTYFDPTSPWYNVFYGAYVLASYKENGEPWGFHADGSPHVDEFLEIPRIDYTYLTAGMFGCPPSRMRFQVDWDTPRRMPDGWHHIPVTRATIPSGLHRVPRDVDYPLAYLMYGVPRPEFLDGGHTEYEYVQMTGHLFMKLLPPAANEPPITLAWGALCPATRDGDRLRDAVIQAMAGGYGLDPADALSVLPARSR